MRLSITDHDVGQWHDAINQFGLLYFYIPQKSSVANPYFTSSKSEATKFIADVFKMRPKPEQQAKLYAGIRYFLDDGGFERNLPRKYYLSPSYAAKYWLNRYLCLTQGLKLPKPDAGVKVAMIMLRTEPKANNPRLMTDAHITACINAIRAANQVAARHGGGTPISHVLLYGDKTQAQMKTFIQKTMADWPLPERRNGLKFLYLTSPFKVDEDKKVNEFWANYRATPGSFSTVPEAVPVEVKMLALFLALQKRYKDMICAIGFRSGTLDGAGFVGIPIFYLDDTATKGSWDTFADLSYLWDGSSKGATIQERMALASQTMNTFVRINIQAEYEIIKGKGSTTTRIVKVDQDEMKHLGAALYIYMFEGNEGDGLLWLRRVSAMNGVVNAKALLQKRCKNFIDEIDGLKT